MKLLYVNGCVNQKKSRTNKLARVVIQNELQKIEEKYATDLIRDDKGRKSIEQQEIRLEDMDIHPLDVNSLEQRIKLCKDKVFEDNMFTYAKQFAEADVIVMAAPYWDMSFPAIVKTYIENICVCGITFSYSKQGFPQGLCHAKKLIYVTTSGGPIGMYNLGYEYIKSLCNVYWGIMNVEFVSKENLDIVGNDSEKND